MHPTRLPRSLLVLPHQRDQPSIEARVTIPFTARNRAGAAIYEEQREGPQDGEPGCIYQIYNRRAVRACIRLVIESHLMRSTMVARPTAGQETITAQSCCGTSRIPRKGKRSNTSGKNSPSTPSQSSPRPFPPLRSLRRERESLNCLQSVLLIKSAASPVSTCAFLA